VSSARPIQPARIWQGLTHDALQRTLGEPRPIFEAVARRDPEMARSWATVHIAGVEEWLRNTLTD
jgi:GntR family transcriptional regulator, transcriptional repressor for pyruvate dehydrogenase complex